MESLQSGVHRINSTILGMGIANNFEVTTPNTNVLHCHRLLPLGSSICPQLGKKYSKIGRRVWPKNTPQSFTLTSFLSFFDLFLLGPLFQSAWQNKDPNVIVLSSLKSFKFLKKTWDLEKHLLDRLHDI